MKRVILYCLIVVAVLLVPVQSNDISELEPIEVVYLWKDGETVTLQTDTKDVGTGKTVRDALADMKHKSAGIVYLDTAEYLLVSEDSLDLISEMKPYLYGSVRISIWEGEGEISEAGRYMRAHKLGCKLKDWNHDVKLPKLPSQKTSN